MKLADNPLVPELDSKYSELVDSVQEYDQALNQYKDSLNNYESVLSNFKEGRASPVEMKEAMDQFVYADDQMMEAAFELEDAVRGVGIEFSVKGGEDSVVSMATEHTLAVQKIEETTDNFSDTGYDFIQSLEELQELDDRIDTTVDIMERDEEFLSESLDYDWEEAMDKVSDYDEEEMEEIDRMVEGWALQEKRNEVISENPNDRYLGGFTSDSGTEDIEGKRKEVLGDSNIQERREGVLGVDEEDLEEARNRVQERDPRYIQ